jgi:hypothetical protein
MKIINFQSELRVKYLSVILDEFESKLKSLDLVIYMYIYIYTLQY